MNRQTRVIRAKTISFLSIAVLVLSSIGLAKYSGGSGEPNNPYQISSVADWQKLMSSPADWGGHFILTSDIDLNGVFIIPIAWDMSTSSGFQGAQFTGVFDGNEHIIRNADLNMPGGDYVGLFGYLGTNGQIKNLGVEDVSILGREYVGGLVGENYGGTISNCYATGPVNGTGSYVGGLVGENYGTIRICYSTASVSGTGGVGGLVGQNYYGTISNCYSTGSVGDEVESDEVGGLVGVNQGTITNCYSTGTVSGGSYVGGLVGYNEAGTISTSFWDVNTSGQEWSAGGTGKTTAEMKTASTFLDAGWDFVGEVQNGIHESWQMPQGGGYPILATPRVLQGRGTPEDPYLISNTLDLGAMIHYSPDAQYRLASSIDLSGIHWGTAVIPWFEGKFDGNGLTISHLTITGGSYLGLFGQLEFGAEVRDLGMVNVNVTGSGGLVGGLVGENSGTISNCYSTGAVSGTGNYVGGLVGWNYSTISNCYSTGLVSGTGDYVGGLVGYNQYDGTINNCYSSGSVSGTGYYVGGLVAVNDGTISNCYSTGSVSGTDYVGGLVGNNGRCVPMGCWYGTVSASFWDTQTSGLSTSAGGTGLTTAQMQTESTFICWAADGVWTIDEGKDYPRLWWENAPGHAITRNYYYGGGSGTEDDPYLIYTAEQLNLVGLVMCDWDKNFKLMCDIDLSGYDGKDGRPAFNIIGTSYNTAFTGVFDGNDHIIRNADVNLPGSDYVGLFGLVGTNGQIKNLGAKAISIVGRVFVGGLVGENYGTISNCYSSGSVTGTGSYSYVGGLVGHNYGTISNCYSSGSVTGTYYVGGLVGENDGGAISNSYSSGSVNGSGGYVGGLVGRNYSTISNCYSTGSVTGTGSYVGGLCGSNSGTISFCFWDIQTSGLATSAGGTGLTTAQMQTESTFICWAADGVWTIDEGKDYPRLWWENAPGHAITRNYYYGGGSGTEADPYLIYTAEHLSMVGLIDCDWDRHFKLMADIDLSGFDGKDGRPSFNIIGTNYSNPFTGVFDGNDHIISNADVNVPGSDYAGLFGYLGTSGQIKNLGVEDISVFGRNYVGGLCGRNYGTIIDCNATGNVSGIGSYVGGLVGYNSGGTITNSYSTSSVSANQYVGGLVGYNSSTITNCYAINSVSGNWYIGGLSGYNGGTITESYSSGPVNGSSYYVGGLVGCNGGTVKNCYSAGSVGGTDYVGGLVGLNDGAISNCYSTGSLNGSSYVGGLVGYNYATISNGYSTGSVSGTNRVGGLVGYNSGGTISSSFWDVNTSGRATSDGGTGLTTAEMQTGGTFCCWGADGVWTIDEGKDYPRLFWEGKPGQPLAMLSDFLEGSGTEDNPYLVSTAEQLNLIGLFLCELDKHFLLASDVNLADYTGTKFNIIGNMNNPFTGVFDGNEYKIWNFTWDSNSIDYIGLFGYLGEGGQIKNLCLENVDVNAVNGSFVGGLVGSNGGGISNCYSTGSASGDGNVGGLVGGNSGTISDCYSTSSVSGTSILGGLVGRNYYGTISNSYSTGSVSGTDYVGGLVGENYYGRLTNCYSTGNVDANDYVGGLAGRNYQATIANSYSVGSVDGNDSVGGLVGENYYSGTVTYCYSTISKCYSTGRVSGMTNVGGLVGKAVFQCDYYADLGNLSDEINHNLRGWDQVGSWGGSSSGDTTARCQLIGADNLLEFCVEQTNIPYVLSAEIVDGTCEDNFEIYVNGIGPIYSYISNKNDGITIKTHQVIIDSGYIPYSLVEVNLKNTSNDLGCGDAAMYYGRAPVYNVKLTPLSYSTGSVSGTTGVDILVGYSYYYATTSCNFWDVNTSGRRTSAGGIGKTTAEMMTMSTFTDAGWDFVGETINGPNDIWRMCVDGVQYPLLSWQFALKGDFTCPDGVDILDLAFLVDRWLDECNETNNFCNCTDTNYDGQVNLPDFAILSSHWLEAAE